MTATNLQNALKVLKVFTWSGLCCLSLLGTRVVHGAPDKPAKGKRSPASESSVDAKPQKTSRLVDVLPVANPYSFFSPGNHLLFPNSAQVYRISKAGTVLSAAYGKFSWQYDSDYYDAKIGFRDEGYRLLSVFTVPGFPVRLGIDYSKSLSYQTTTAEIRNRITGNTATSSTERFAETSRPRVLVGFPLFKNIYGGLGLETGARTEKARGVSDSVSFSAIDAGVVLSTAAFEAGVSYFPGIDEDDGDAAFSQVGQTILHSSYFVAPAIAAEATIIWNRWKEGPDDEVKDAPELGLGASLHGAAGRGTLLLDYGPNFRKKGEFSWLGVMIDGRVAIGATAGIGSTFEYRRVALSFEEDEADNAKYKNPNSYVLSMRGEYVL